MAVSDRVAVLTPGAAHTSARASHLLRARHLDHRADEQVHLTAWRVRAELRGNGDAIRGRNEQGSTRDFVTREEFDAVRAMAQKAREENEALKARLDALEAASRK